MELPPARHNLAAYCTDRASNKTWEKQADRDLICKTALDSLLDRDLWPTRAAHQLAKFFGQHGLGKNKEANYSALKFSIWGSMINRVSITRLMIRSYEYP